MQLITGNTFPVKDQIKALGGKWDADAKGWRVSDERADEARQLVSGAAKSSGRPTPRGSRVERTYKRRYGWDGVRGSASYYASGMYDEES